MDPERIRRSFRRRRWLVIPLTLVPLFLFRVVSGILLIPLPKLYESTAELTELSPPLAQPGSELPIDWIWAEVVVWEESRPWNEDERNESIALLRDHGRVRISESGDRTIISARASSPSEAQELVRDLVDTYSGWQRLRVRQRAGKDGFEVLYQREAVELNREDLRDDRAKFHAKAANDEFYAKVIGRIPVSKEELVAGVELAQLHDTYQNLEADLAAKDKLWEELSKNLGFRELPPRVECVVEEEASFPDLPIEPNAKRIQNVSQVAGVTLGFGIWLILVLAGRVPDRPVPPTGRKKRPPPKAVEKQEPGWVDY